MTTPTANHTSSPSSPSAWIAGLLTLPVLLPVLAIIILASKAGVAGWPALFTELLPELALTTLLLCGACGVITLCIGTVMAWLSTMYHFPGRPFLKWGALLPLAMPGYIVSFTYVDFLSFSGPLQTWLRSVTGLTMHLPDIRSLPGAILVLSFVLYPYVYLTARAAFLKQPATQIAVARTLGRTPLSAFIDVTLPQARPALFIGVVLVVMECLNDIGAASFFGIRTITYAIFSIWLDQGNLNQAAQVASLLLLFLAVLLGMEYAARSRDGLSREARNASAITRERLAGWRGWLATLVMTTPIVLGFALPALLLARHALRRAGDWLSPALLSAVWHSLLLAAMTVAVTLLIALMIGHANRQSNAPVLKWLTRFASFGYALPGTVLGIGVLVSLGRFDRTLNAWLVSVFDWQPGLILSGTALTLVFAYVARFLIIASGQVEAGFGKIPFNLDHVARTLGRKPLAVLRDVHIPLLRPQILSAALLVFVDTMKELPATLVLRPFDFETLATHVFTLASLGQLEDSAIPALAIVATGLLPVFMLARAMREAVRR
jgi:iron(III) transport system permease protein